MKYLKFLLIIIFLISISFAQSVPEFVPGRPDQTESSVTVPKGWLQIESGVLSENDSPHDKIDHSTLVYNTTLLRYGLFDKTELRFGVEYQKIKNTSYGIKVEEAGLLPFVVGFKTQLTEENGFIPEMAFIGNLTLPWVGNEVFTADYITPDFRIAVTKTLTDRLAVAYNIGGEWDGVSPQTNVFYSFISSLGIHEKIGTFVEVYGYLIEEDKPDHRFDTGLTYLVNDSFQLDIAGGFGINDKAPDYFITGGLSYRFRLSK